jgi:hypothetical protein
LEHLLIPAAAVVAAVLVAEIVASIRFNRWYFTTGIPIFMRRVDRLSGLDDVAFEKLQKGTATVAGAPFLFHRFDANTIGSREKVFSGGILYFPLMRCLIRRDRGEPAVKVTGFINWTFVAFLVAWVAAFGRQAHYGLGYIALALAILYLIQGVRYWRLGNAIRSA